MLFAGIEIVQLETWNDGCSVFFNVLSSLLFVHSFIRLRHFTNKILSTLNGIEYLYNMSVCALCPPKYLETKAQAEKKYNKDWTIDDDDDDAAFVVCLYVRTADCGRLQIK